MGKNQCFQFWLLILLFHCESIKIYCFNLGKFGDCCFEATSDSERRISKKSCYFLFIFSEIYDNTYVFLRSNFDNFSWKFEDILILKGFWKEKATTMFVIEYEKKREKNYKLWIVEFSNSVGIYLFKVNKINTKIW